MAKDKLRKPRRPRAETPKGFRDYFGAEVRARQAMLARICEVYHAWGFDPLETSAVETVEALGKFLPDVDRPNEGVFAWQDEDERWLALRYDLTAPLARVFAQHRMSLPTPYRRYQVGPVWRNEKPGPGRFRQFYQCDADTVGAASVAADAEMCAMLGEALEAAGIARGDYAVRINNRKVLNGVMEVAGLLDPADPEAHATRRGIVMRAIDKIDRLGARGVRALLGAGRRDESGDFTAGAGLGESEAELILAFMAARAEDGAATCARLRDLVGGSRAGLEGVQELETIAELLAARGAAAVVDPAVVRGLGYYTGPVVEAELTFQVVDEDGRPRQFGSVAGGGRYDDLVRRFTGEAVPATGVSIGVDRLLAALGERESVLEAGPVVVTVMDRAEMAGYQAMAAELRGGGLRAEVFLGGGNMARQLKYADQRSAAVAVIEGGDERARGVVQLKDLALGARLAAEIATHEDWKAQPAQVEVPRAGLVEAVRVMLARPMVADRAFLAGARLGPGLARLDGEVARILGVLRSTGATTVKPAALQPADVLLDLYGEDIRARAFVTRDDGAEMMLRPDFTVPIVRLHMDAGAEPARYVYCGPVWRRQDAGSVRPREFLQAGFEVFEAGDPAAHDAEVLGLITEALGDAPVDLVTGDLGLLLAAIDACDTTTARKAALRRHMWRPAQFHALLRQFGAGHGAERARRAALLSAQAEGRTAELVGAGIAVGLRGADEVVARVARLAEEAATPPLAEADVARVEAVLAVKGSASEAAGALRRLARGLPGLAAAVDRLETRLAAFAARGIVPETLRFEASFGRTSLEYYDGMVFGAMPRGRDDLPPVASGGRYDTLTRVLGQGRGIPAVGGIIRPEALVALCG